MKNYRIEISYDGSKYFGSQSQSNGKTVQDEIEAALLKLTGKKVRISLAGRTDRGVNAQKQVANFRVRTRIPAEKFPAALNSVLSDGIRVNRGAVATAAFDSRRRARRREYMYLIFNGATMPVLFWGKALHVRGKLDLKKMAAAARCLVGEHDFVAFCANSGVDKSTIRRIFRVEIGSFGSDIVKDFGTDGKMIFVRVVADSFLYKMVRFITGALLDVGRGRMKPADLKAALDGKNGKVKRWVVPSCGLYLSDVKY